MENINESLDFEIDEDGELIRYNGNGGDVVIPGEVTEIGERAFKDCTGLTSVTIPNSVMRIGEYVFGDCYKLTSIMVDENNPKYSSEDGVLFSKDKTKIIAYPTGKTDKSFAIPSFVTNIGTGAFAVANFTSITIPDSVTSIGSYAFYGTNLTNINIPNSVTSIGERAFEDCISLRRVTIPDSVTSIGWGAFNGCWELASITIPNSVTSIDDETFAECYGLMRVTIPDSVTSIGWGAFNGCWELASITIPGSVTRIGGGAFYDCTGLETVTLTGVAANPYGNIFGKAKVVCVPNENEIIFAQKKCLERVTTNAAAQTANDYDSVGQLLNNAEKKTKESVKKPLENKKQLRV